MSLYKAYRFLESLNIEIPIQLPTDEVFNHVSFDSHDLILEVKEEIILHGTEKLATVYATKNLNNLLKFTDYQIEDFDDFDVEEKEFEFKLKLGDLLKLLELQDSII